VSTTFKVRTREVLDDIRSWTMPGVASCDEVLERLEKGPRFSYLCGCEPAHAAACSGRLGQRGQPVPRDDIGQPIGFPELQPVGGGKCRDVGIVRRSGA